jgi:hypothetical protein
MEPTGDKLAPLHLQPLGDLFSPVSNCSPAAAILALLVIKRFCDRKSIRVDFYHRMKVIIDLGDPGEIRPSKVHGSECLGIQGVRQFQQRRVE